MSLSVTMQVFDSGLIGEGVLHMLAAAKQKLLTKDAVLVPAAATVFCQPLQMRIGQASTVSSPFAAPLQHLCSPVAAPLQHLCTFGGSSLAFPFAHSSLPFALCLSGCLSLSGLPSLDFPLCVPFLVVPPMLLLSSHADALQLSSATTAAVLLN